MGKSTQRWVVSLAWASMAVGLTGCFGFPRKEAEYKARLLRQKGLEAEAQILERKAKEEPETTLQMGTSSYDPYSDPYHFPELQVPPEKRKYQIRISTVSTPSQ